MLKIILNAALHSVRDRLLQRIDLPGPTLLEHVTDLARTSFKNAALVGVTNDPDTAQAMDRLGLADIAPIPDDGNAWPWVSAVKAAVREEETANHLLVLSPFEGSISLKRVQSIMRACPEDAPVVSAREMASNCHPSWCHMYPTNFLEETSASFQKEKCPKPFSPKKHLDPTLLRHFPTYGKIKGSQWLPELTYVDAAVVCMPWLPATSKQLEAPQTWRIHTTPADNLADVWHYKLPFFWMHKNCGFAR